MAWNSTYESRAGIFTLTFVSPQDGNKQYDYTFQATLSFTQERNLTDTLNKFSLDIVDDGSENFHGLENIILSGITNIRMTYGVGTDNQVSWSGFVYDYSSAFFGQKVKLSLIGYVTLSNNNNNDYAGHYYRLDWSPMVPYRNDFKKEWDLFQTSDYVWQRDGKDVEIQKFKKDDFLKTYESDYDKAVESGAKAMDNGGAGETKWYNPLTWIGNIGDGFKGVSDYKNLIKEYVEKGKNSGAYLGGLFGYDMEFFEIYFSSAVSAYESLEKAKKRYDLYESLYNAYFNRYRKGNFAVDFDITHLKNSVFSYFPSDYSSDRQILIPVPDIFIQWDGILPKPHHNGKKWEIDYTSLLGTLNDVTAFGLKCEIVPGTSNDKDNENEPKIALKGVKDQYNNVRVLKMNNATFICVSDARALAEKRWGKFTGESDFTEAVASASTTSSTSKITLSETANKIYNYFHGRGWSDAAIAAVLGNGECESGLVPNKLQGGTIISYNEAYQLYPEDKQDGHAWGIWQWDPLMKIHPTAGRSWSTRISGDRNSVEVQCAILESQLNNNGWTSNHYNLSVEDFKSCTDIQKTSRAFLCNFEICKGWDTDEKQQSRAATCSKYLNGIQGFSASETEAKIADNTVVPKSWYRSYYNYCLSAFRSALPLQYGGVYISDIVAKLCKIEGWTSEITPTIWSSFEAIQNELVMNGRNALDYIVNVLAPISTSESGYTGYVVRLHDNHLTFKPAIPDTLGTLNIKMGYNIPDSPVLSFVCKTRGNFIMHGVAEEVSTVTSYSNESAVLQTYTKSESFIESKFASKSTTQGSNWFSKGLFSYYGFMNTLEGYNSFFSSFYSSSFKYGENRSETSFTTNSGLTVTTYSTGEVEVSNSTNSNSNSSSSKTIINQGSVVNASLSSSLIRSTPYSSLGDMSGAQVLTDLKKFEDASIKAEITIIGDNRIIPNSYIEIINMTKRGRHYTSGIYWINKITDSFSKGEWTQKIECNRYDSNVDFFNRSDTNMLGQVDNSMSELIDMVITKDITMKQVDDKLKSYLKQ